MDIEQEMERFEAYLFNNGKSEKTIEKRIRNVRLLLESAGGFSKDKILSHINKLRKEGRKSNTLNSKIGSYRSYAKFKGCYDEISEVKYLPVRDESIRKTFTDREIEKVLDLPPHENDKYPKLYEMWTVFYKVAAYTGLRGGEIASLKKSDIDFGTSTIRVQKTKNGRPHQVPILPNIYDDLKKYTQNLDRKHLFRTRTGKEPYPQGWSKSLKRRLERLGIDKNLSLHNLRHTFATKLIEEDVGIEKVSKYLNHKDISTTMRYAHMTIKDLQEAGRKLKSVRESIPPKEQLQMIGEELKNLNLDKDKFRVKMEQENDRLSFEVVVDF